MPHHLLLRDIPVQLDHLKVYELMAIGHWNGPVPTRVSKLVLQVAVHAATSKRLVQAYGRERNHVLDKELTRHRVCRDTMGIIAAFLGEVQARVPQVMSLSDLANETAHCRDTFTQRTHAIILLEADDALSGRWTADTATLLLWYSHIKYEFCVRLVHELCRAGRSTGNEKEYDAILINPGLAISNVEVSFLPLSKLAIDRIRLQVQIRIRNRAVVRARGIVRPRLFILGMLIYTKTNADMNTLGNDSATFEQVWWRAPRCSLCSRNVHGRAARSL